MDQIAQCAPRVVDEQGTVVFEKRWQALVGAKRPPEPSHMPSAFSRRVTNFRGAVDLARHGPALLRGALALAEVVALHPDFRHLLLIALRPPARRVSSRSIASRSSGPKKRRHEKGPVLSGVIGRGFSLRSAQEHWRSRKLPMLITRSTASQLKRIFVWLHLASFPELGIRRRSCAYHPQLSNAQHVTLHEGTSHYSGLGF